jgi:hypothetical protein
VPLAGLDYPAFAGLLEEFVHQAEGWIDAAVAAAAARADGGDGREAPPAAAAGEAPRPLLFDPRMFA